MGNKILAVGGYQAVYLVLFVWKEILTEGKTYMDSGEIANSYPSNQYLEITALGSGARSVGTRWVAGTWTQVQSTGIFVAHRSTAQGTPTAEWAFVTRWMRCLHCGSVSITTACWMGS